MPASPQAQRYIVRGRVQGVGFRYFVQQLAQELHLDGYVKNRADGGVEVYASGTAKKLKDFERRLWSGPRLSRVENIEQYTADSRERVGFHVEW